MPDPGRDKREAILTTALALFTERGFYGTPTSLISREAGVATGTLFFYFRTKEELIDELYRQIKSEAGATLRKGVDQEPTVKDKIRRVGLNAMAWGIKNPKKIRFMEQFAHSPFVSTTAHEEGMSQFLFLQELVLEGINNGVIRNYDPRLLCSVLASSLSSLLALVMEIHDSREREALIAQGLDFVWNGLKT
jgi:AcrR family transcriptional regulator